MCPRNCNALLNKTQFAAFNFEHCENLRSRSHTTHTCLSACRHSSKPTKASFLNYVTQAQKKMRRCEPKWYKTFTFRNKPFTAGNTVFGRTLSLSLISVSRDKIKFRKLRLTSHAKYYPCEGKGDFQPLPTYSAVGNPHEIGHSHSYYTRAQLGYTTNQSPPG